MSQSAEILKEQFFKSLGFPWQDILPASRLTEILEAEGIGYRSRLYTPVVDAMGNDSPSVIGR